MEIIVEFSALPPYQVLPPARTALHGQHLVNPTGLSARTLYFECVWSPVKWGTPLLSLVGSRGIRGAWELFSFKTF